MIEHIETIKKMHGVVWHYRGLPELVAVWPTPSPKNSLRFAVTECAEVMDAAYLRNGDFARNNEREPDVLKELADVGMMLCTALGSDFSDFIGDWENIHVDFVRTIDQLCSHVAGANLMVSDHYEIISEPWALQVIFTALDIVCHLFAERDADPVAYVEAKLQRTYAKFVKGEYKAERLAEIVNHGYR